MAFHDSLGVVGLLTRQGMNLKVKLGVGFFFVTAFDEICATEVPFVYPIVRVVHVLL